MRAIAIVPARGGSKGIPRKNMRLMGGRPLISYAIENALGCGSIDSVAVSSDSMEILSYAGQYEGVLALDRASELARDAVTLDPVVYDAVLRAEEALGVDFDVVITLQPTSPLLSARTLREAIDAFEQEDVDTMISVINAPHLRWKEDGGAIVPAYSRRLNRQQLPPNYLETGAFLITRRASVTESSRIGQRVGVFEMPEDEATDIDTWRDWAVCEAVLGRKRIVFRADGYKELGLGHIYRALTLAYDMTEHDVVFVCDKKHQLGIERLRAANMTVVEVGGDDGLVAWLEGYRPDVYVHDCLDTSTELMRRIKPHVGRLVTFEDLGDGAREADAVVNAIYEGASRHLNVYTGKAYVALRDEFLSTSPKEFGEQAHRVLVMFGGTDPLDLSARVYRMAEDYNAGGIRAEFDFVLGSGYEGAVQNGNPDLGIGVTRDVVRVSDHMKLADMAFSSQGRTTFELASMGVPTIVLAQNEREQLHRFAQMDNGFINLGLGSEVSDEDIRSTFEWLSGSVSIRKEMRRLMLDNDLKSGIGKVKRIILGETL
ncbi:cytidylyltransferase domain-containing protein [Adlercreutzia sp. ZJ242]|uniref:cytidylyltransferase domain-containing protein n=1 Tax=Adlercreutzia sp. ZJ242 TaxID=2709409 RepID=UPI0013EA68B1|nr:acylneuraminate cytidylyltransferase [Adlercreutzia sp. ZJ242]